MCPIKPFKICFCGGELTFKFLREQQDAYVATSTDIQTPVLLYIWVSFSLL